MATSIVTDGDGNLWAMPLGSDDVDRAVLILKAEDCNPKYRLLLSSAAVHYQQNLYAAQLIEAHTETLERVKRDDLAVSFVEMAANLQYARRCSIEGLAALVAKKDRNGG